MTDTTDIKALRERMMQQREAALTGSAPSFEDCELLACDLLRALSLSNKQIEAERQRAEAKMPEISNLCLKIWRLEEEIAALKGDQVPVGVWCIQEVTDDDGSLSRTEFLSVTDGVKIPKDAPLFTAPQKPVVLPSPYYGDRHCLDKREVIAAIEAAGGIVKDGE